MDMDIIGPAPDVPEDHGVDNIMKFNTYNMLTTYSVLFL